MNVSELFDLPERVKKADFVLNLAKGVAAPEDTVRQYVMTPSIERSFDAVLGLTAAALRDRTSIGVYVHGSFGSGKSHFMAMVSLMLDGAEAAWRRPELHPLKDKYRELGGKRLLQLRFHMVGQANLEAALFTTYSQAVQERHPKAALPPLFDDAPLFENARAMLAAIGEEKFFSALGGGEADKEWGDLGRGWTLERFEEAARSTQPVKRAELYSALVKSPLFSAFAQQSSGFIDIDRGLSVMTQHASELGYDGIVLFLDELVLWLSQGAGKPDWLHNEAQKVVKLVEFQNARVLPIVSLVARQRDLAEMVGEQLAGSEAAALQQSLRWSHERFDRVNLEDTNLPTIVAKRLLAPKPGAAAQIDAAFAKLQTSAKKSWNTLLGQEDGEAFRKLYPFSPALVEALVGLSNSLQRNRTAIRLLTEMLVEHLPDLKLGDVVPVGDLFDLIAGGDSAADGVMRPRLESAQQLYQHKLLPMLREQHSTTSPERCQRLRPAHPQKLGCAGCPEKACRNSNRIVKTLLLAALVPEVPSFKGLTATRLVELNHGAIQSVVPGKEAAQVVVRLQAWAQQVGALHLGEQADPTVSLHLDGIDLDPILEQYQAVNTPGARQRRVRDLLFSRTNLPAEGDRAAVDQKVDWHETARRGQVLFGNVRKLASAGSEDLRCPDDHDWRLVIDYPFDDHGYGPQDDLSSLDELVSRRGPSWTVCWLPSFFSERANRQLGQLVILDHILATNASAQQAVRHLSPAEQQRALSDLRSLQAQKLSYLGRVLEQAYGLRKAEADDLDVDLRLENNLYSMASDEPLSPALASTLETAVRSYVVALLEKRYPNHPRFGRKLTKGTMGEALALFGRLIDGGEKRLALPKDKIALLMETLGALEIVRGTESAVLLAEDRLLRQLEQERLKGNENRPSVAQVRRWIDPEQQMGLTPEAQDLVVRAYARWDSRAIIFDGKPHDELKALPPTAELDKPELPTAMEWERALELAGAVFGIALGTRALSADSVKRLESQLAEQLSKVAIAATQLPETLATRQRRFNVDLDSDRARTARSAQELCGRLDRQGGLAQVRVLAAFDPVTSPRALGRSLSQANACVQILVNDLVFGHFSGIERWPAGVALLDKLRAALRQDEVLTPLVDTIEGLAQDAMRLGAANDQRENLPPSGQRVIYADEREADGRTAALRALDALYGEAKAKLAAANSQGRFTFGLSISAQPGVAPGRGERAANDADSEPNEKPAARSAGKRHREGS
jgi:hypothetical protein